MQGGRAQELGPAQRAGASAEGQQVHTELWVTGQTQARAQQRRSRAVGECGRGNERPARSCKRRPRRGRRVPPSPAPPGDPGRARSVPPAPRS